MRRRFPVAAALGALIAIVATDVAAATFPGQNGKIVYTRENTDQSVRRLCTIDPDGTDKACATTRGQELTPAWSPDGQKILFRDFLAFGNENDLTTVAPDFTNRTFVLGDGWDPEWSPEALGKIVFAGVHVNPPVLATSNVDGSGFAELPLPFEDNGYWMPDWSPDGKRVVYQANLANQWDLFLFDVETEQSELLTSHQRSKYDPDFSPDGTKVLYTASDPAVPSPQTDHLFSVNLDGTGLTDLGPGHAGKWSPDGTKILFTDGARDIYVADADGSNRTLLNTRFDDLPDRPTSSITPDWQSLPVDTPSSYVRPAGASPFRASLVPAAEPCTAPNRTHGPPLAFPSCNPPDPASPNLTVGVGDGDPALSRSIGFMRLAVQPGTPGGADDTDVRIRFSLSNVMKVSDLSEYTGELRASAQLRLTDRDGAAAQTTVGVPLEFDIPCAGTTEPLDKSLCAITTTLDTLTPGAAAEGTRALFELDQVKVFDGGPDGDGATTADNSLFAVQGIFIP